MPSAARRVPAAVEVHSDNDSSRASVGSSSPPKSVRFPDHAEIITGVTRPLTPTEAWSLYYFEIHARSCKTCHQPYQTVVNGGRLCSEGHDLAYDVAMHVYHRDGQVYSVKREKSRDIRVEVPHGYDRLVALLKAMEQRASRKPRLAPIISYESKYSSAQRAPAVQSIREEEEPWTPTYVVARTRNEKRARQKPVRYSTIKVGGDDQYARLRLASIDEKLGSLYKESGRKEYMIEVLETSEDRQRRRRKEYYD
ncbi:hypothetical protein AMS68_007271 [Peltaster fructicola]|uniref:Uncharacterized protein n=1 Tax=Peltaster fructicola TaxID=286661 RepID=A0A6H0Y418_9PEZI|nr:hypothetical protein AMS68_007271 [Peltaster fructicola]